MNAVIQGERAIKRPEVLTWCNGATCASVKARIIQVRIKSLSALARFYGMNQGDQHASRLLCRFWWQLAV